MKRLPYDLVADWRPERSTDLPGIAQDLASLAAAFAFCAAIAAAAVLFA